MPQPEPQAEARRRCGISPNLPRQRTQWRASHPGYWKRYRAAKSEAAGQNRAQQRQRDRRQRLAALANANSALDLTELLLSN